jgi:glycosyltransferase involved in cell wall biosynthesis
MSTEAPDIRPVRSWGRRPRFVSVVIAARNAADTLPDQLEALASQTYNRPWEVVIADNGSTDATRETAERWRSKLPGLRVVDASDRRGSSHARNVAASAARGDLLVSCDADDVAAPGWLEAIVRTAEHYDIVRGALERSALSHDSGRRRLTAHEPPYAVVSNRFLPFASTANCGVWTAVFRDLGGWDPEFMAAEDKEFSWRGQLAGYTFGVAPDAVMLKRDRQSMRGAARQWYVRGWWGTRLYRSFRDQGMPRTRIWGMLRDGLLVLGGVPTLLLGRQRRISWMRLFAFRVGRFVGCVQNRVLYF